MTSRSPPRLRAAAERDVRLRRGFDHAGAEKSLGFPGLYTAVDRVHRPQLSRFDAQLSRRVEELLHRGSGQLRVAGLPLSRDGFTKIVAVPAGQDQQSRIRD